MSRPPNLRRQNARQLGEPFFTGAPCPVDSIHGNVRYTSTGGCVECARLRRYKPGQSEPAERPQPRGDSYERREALERGRTTYEGDACRVNPAHGVHRYTGNGRCIECAKDSAKRTKATRGPRPEAPLLASRRAAADVGASMYQTGEPCVNGHTSPRYTRSGKCKACHERGKPSAPLIYPTHPEDYEAAVAYLQSLDLARGRMPSKPRIVFPK